MSRDTLETSLSSLLNDIGNFNISHLVSALPGAGTTVVLLDWAASSFSFLDHARRSIIHLAPNALVHALEDHQLGLQPITFTVSIDSESPRLLPRWRRFCWPSIIYVIYCQSPISVY